MTLLILFFFMSIGFSFLCSIWEAVLLCITPAFVTTLEREKPSLGERVRRFKEEVDRPLSAILSLNTMAHTVGAIGVGVQAGKVFGAHTLALGVVHISYESIIAGIMTMAILILSEIIPKTIGANYWKELTPFTIRSVSILMVLLKPLVWLSQWITKHLKKDKEKSVLSRADFAAFTEIGAQSGAINKNESRIIGNLLKLQSIKSSDIMTPRSVMVAADEQWSAAGFCRKFPESNFSRIPLYHEAPDNITGFVLRDEILSRVAEGQGDVLLKTLQRQVPVVSPNQLLPDLLDSLLEKRSHLAVVVNEFGSVLGLVTMEDVLETLLGIEIVDETDTEVDLQALARKKWEDRAQKHGLTG
ncbi:MAG: hemolysin [Desulfobulbus sp.]|nr:MAG: hemolysin [Desulfobulbus sp.]